VLKERRVESKEIRRKYKSGNSERMRERWKVEERRNARKRKERKSKWNRNNKGSKRERKRVQREAETCASIGHKFWT